jgi:hypothetical protein
VVKEASLKIFIKEKQGTHLTREFRKVIRSSFKSSMTLFSWITNQYDNHEAMIQDAMNTEHHGGPNRNTTAMS